MATTPTDRDGPGRPELTAREMVIVGLMASGNTTAEIGALLNLRPRTVENHKRHIYEKLDVGTQHGAVARAIAYGLLDGPGRGRWPAQAGRSMIVLIRGPAGVLRDAVTSALAADGTPFVSVRDHEAAEQDHWARWHRGPVLSVLIEPEPEDWAWSAALNAMTVVVKGNGGSDRAVVVDALSHRANGLLVADDVQTGLASALRVVASGFFVLSSAYASALSAWRPQASTTIPQLTPRERDILDSIARGHTIRQTARALGIAAKTVENTQARLFRKLGARNRSETLAIAWEVGLLDGSSPRDDSRTDRILAERMLP
jgi:DNA-binding CsgD family transcriptional regulator